MGKEYVSDERAGKQYFLDDYEQEIADNFESLVELEPKEKKKLINSLVAAAKEYNAEKTQVNISIATNDLKAIKYKASKLGIPYKVFLNMVIHQHAASTHKEV